VNHEPTRTRKMLLNKKEIERLIGAVERQGHTLVPLELYFSARGIAKIRMAIGRGKKDHDKRESIKEREAQREIARAMRSRR
jgi:SsrA-binding protein